MNQEILTREPLGFRGTIPFFSTADEYTDNYEQISADHLASMKATGDNPFIREDLWLEFEESTAILIKKYAPPSARILDAGVGLGRLLSYFPSLERYGIDISFGYLEKAQEQGIDVCYSLIEDLPYKPQSFDVVVCTDVLEHVLDLNACCAKLLAVLKDEGTLIVRVPYRENLSPYLEPSYPYKYVHLRSFDEHSLRLHFERIFDCVVVDTSVVGHVPDSIRLKYPLPIPKRDSILQRALPRIERLHLPTYESLLKKLYYPIVINVVITKTRHPIQDGERRNERD